MSFVKFDSVATRARIRERTLTMPTIFWFNVILHLNLIHLDPLSYTTKAIKIRIKNLKIEIEPQHINLFSCVYYPVLVFV